MLVEAFLFFQLYLDVGVRVILSFSPVVCIAALPHVILMREPIVPVVLVSLALGDIHVEEERVSLDFSDT